MNRDIDKSQEIPDTKTQKLTKDQLDHYVASYLDSRDDFLAAAKRCGSPLYVLEPDVLRDRARTFTRAFGAKLPDIRVYYALKSNHHPVVAQTLVQEGLGLDVSSGLELQLAIDCGADDIVFSGPGIVIGGRVSNRAIFC